MTREQTFYDDIFHRENFDPYDEGDFEPDLVFLIMPFKGMDDVYLAITDECKKLGLHAHRADGDTFPGSEMIISEITVLIEKAEFIVCDLTSERPNVYYELGYAHGVGNKALEILLIAQEGTALHFDIAPLRVQYYASLEQLRKIVFSSLEVMIKKTRRG